MPGDRARRHRYYAHYYAMPCGDVYLITPKGQIKVVLADRDDCLLVWCPKDGLYPHYWIPNTTILSISHPQRGDDPVLWCLDSSFGAPMTDDTLCIMTSPVSGLIIRRGVIIYDGKMDGRWVPAKEVDAFEGDTETLIVNQQWAKDEEGNYLGKGTDPYNHWTWHRKTRRGNCRPNFRWLNFTYRCRNFYAEEGDAAPYLHIGQSNVYTRGFNADTPCFSPGRYENVDEVRWTEQRGIVWGADPMADTEIGERNVVVCEQMNVFVDRDRGGLPITNAIQDGRNGSASFQIESRVKRFKWRTWLGEIADVTELPGYLGVRSQESEYRSQNTEFLTPDSLLLTPNSYILTDWKAVRDYEIKIPESVSKHWAGTHLNAGTVIRQGLQTGDCFYNEESDKYWRMEYNGWKEYDGYAKRRSDDVTGKYGIITPSMTAQHSAHVSG